MNFGSRKMIYYETKSTSREQNLQSSKAGRPHNSGRNSISELRTQFASFWYSSWHWRDGTATTFAPEAFAALTPTLYTVTVFGKHQVNGNGIHFTRNKSLNFHFSRKSITELTTNLQSLSIQIYQHQVFLRLLKIWEHNKIDSTYK